MNPRASATVSIGVRVYLVLALLIAAPVGAEELDAETLAQLKRDKVAYGKKNYRQLFDAYVAAKVPVFITSDTVLHAWHVLLERSVQRLEWHRARNVPRALRIVWDRLPKVVAEQEFGADLERRALRRARLVFGVALVLAGGEPEGAPGPVVDLIRAEAKRVEAAEGLSKPAWLGPPEADFKAIDYGDFRPRGFYATEEPLQRAFRASRWLKVVPFFLDRDEDLAALHIISRAWGGAAVPDFDLDGYERLVPVIDTHTATDFVGAFTDTTGPQLLAELRKEYRKGMGSWRPWDLVAERRPRANLRVLPALRLPEDDLFDTLSHADNVRPDGMTICAALGSSWARAQLGPRKTKIGPLNAGDTVASDYYQCVAALLDKAEPDAPALFSQPAWKRKSCRTALASWAQWRHTFSLHASDRFAVLGIPKGHAGFVEPDPEFFGRLAALARRTQDWVAGLGCFSESMDRAEIADSLRSAVADVEKNRITSRRKLPLLAGRVLDAARYRDMEDMEESALIAAILRRAAKDYDDSTRSLTPAFREVLQRHRSRLELRWRHLHLCCKQLEALAHKQLRGKLWNERESKWIRDFGPRLGFLLFYDSTSWLYPNDDVPKVSVVFRDPRRRQRLHVAIGRPRPIYVLYPWKGEEVRCRGAVLDYFEFEDGAALTDKEFLARLDGTEPPRALTWLSKR